MKTLKRIFSFFLIFCFFTTNVHADEAFVLEDISYIDVDEIDINENNEIDYLFAPAVVPVAQAFAYLLALFGVISINEIYNSDDSSFYEWYNQKILDFKLKCEVLGIGADAVEDWLLSLSNGVLIKSSEVWTAFKSWVADLRSAGVSAEPGSAEDFKNGYMRANTSYNLCDLLVSPSFDKYDYYYIIPERDIYVFGWCSTNDISNGVKYVFLGYSIKNDYGNITIPSDDESYVGYRMKRVYKLKNGVEKTVYDCFSFDVNEKSFTYFNGIQYDYFCYFSSGSLDDFSTSCVPYFTGSNQFDCIRKFFNYISNVNNLDYTFVGNITDFTGVDIVSPGATPGADVNLNWDLLNPGSSVVGVGSGSTTWQDFINSSGLTLEENGVIVGGDTVIDTPDVDVPDVDLPGSSILDKILSWLNGFFNSLAELLKSLFVPYEGYFVDQFNNIKNNFSNNFGFSDYSDFLVNLQSIKGVKPNFYGYINIDIWDKFIPAIQKFIKGFFYVFIIIFNIKMALWLVRGTHPINSNNK